MRFVARWGKRIGLALLLMLIAATIASAIYDGVTKGGVSRHALYAGPYVQVDGRELAYRTWGTHGTPIVLIGGFIEATDVWRRVAPLLGHTHRVFALDLPPFGYSERKGPFLLSTWLDEVEGFNRALHIVRPTLVGHSLGAAVAVGVALRRPRALRAIVLLDGDALRSGGAPSWVSSLIVDPYYTALYRFVTGSDWIFHKGLKTAYGPGAPRLTHGDIDAWQRPFRVAGTAEAFRQMLPHGIQGLTVDDLRRARGVRAVVAWGAHDTTDGIPEGRKTAEALQAPFILIPKAGHLSMLANPRGVARAVLAAAGR